MEHRISPLAGSTAAVFGASGGIGSEVCAELSRRGARVIGLGRRPQEIEKAFKERGIEGRALNVDLDDADSLAAALEALEREAPGVVVFAAGYDVRKPFLEHGEPEIARSLSTNFLSLVRICRRLLPSFLIRRTGRFAYVGAFGDGSLAFPFHSVDAATRAASASLLESLNRECRGDVRFLYFGPTAVRTKAEEPYLGHWREIGVPIVEAGEVARRLVEAILRGKRSVAMGPMTRLGIVANKISPGLMDALFMDAYRKTFSKAFAGGRGVN
jgi:short-subunit dehydrogenase